MVLRDEPRITLGIPVVGCPDYVSLLTPRIAEHPPSTGQRELAAPAFPASLAQLVAKEDPCAVDYRSHDPSVNPYIGKQILVLGGAEDRLVPPKHGQKMFEDMYLGPHGAKEMIVQEGVGHHMSPEMLERAGEWLWKYGVNDGAAVAPQHSQL